MTYVVPCDAITLVKRIREPVNLIATDPPYFGIVSQDWDNQWKSVDDYAAWWADHCAAFLSIAAPNSTLIFFGATGMHGHRPFWRAVEACEKSGWRSRDIITWGKKRAYGKSTDYLYCREEIAFFTNTWGNEHTFNVPLTTEKRQNDNPKAKYQAKSEFKRVTNVWSDITEVMAPERECQKPIELMERIVATHSNVNDVVIDPFVGWGTTGVACGNLSRKFAGSDTAEDWEDAEKRIEYAFSRRCVDGRVSL